MSDETYYDYMDRKYGKGVRPKNCCFIEATDIWNYKQSKIEELEKQLLECKRNYNQLFGSSSEIEKSYKIKLAESVPKSEIRTILNIHAFDAPLMPVHNLLAHLKDLLTPPAKENNS